MFTLVVPSERAVGLSLEGHLEVETGRASVLLLDLSSFEFPLDSQSWQAFDTSGRSAQTLV